MTNPKSKIQNLKFLHTADIHLGYETYGRINPETGLNSRLEDFVRCFEFMVARAVEEDVDLFLFCGDAYRTADPTPTQQKLFAQCLAPLAKAGIPMAMVVGNHDHPVTFGKASAIDIFEHIEGQVQVFRRPDFARIETKSGPLQLIAMPWPIRSLLLSKDEHKKKSPVEIRDLIEEMYGAYIEKVCTEQADPDLPCVLAGHFSVIGAEMSGSERTSLISNEPKFNMGVLTRPPVDYVALGHIHRYQDNNPGGVPVVYASSIERINFKEIDDRKGFVIVDIEAGGEEKRTTFEFVPTPARTFVAVDADVREAEEPTAAILRDIARHDVADAIVRVRYRVDEAQVPLVDVRQLRDALKGAHAIAAIERKVDPIERERRTIVTRETTLRDAMTQYIAQHDNLASVRDDMITAALALEEEFESKR